MHDPRDENDTLRDVAKQTSEPRQDPTREERAGRVQDGSGLVPDAMGKREVRERRAAEREAESGGLGTGIGDDRKGRKAPREGEPE